MSTPSNRQFGKKITKSEANRLHKNFLKIKKRALPKILGPLEHDFEALRYYCGKNSDGTFRSDDAAFIFDYDGIKDLLQILIEQDNKGIKGGLVIMNGSRDADDSDPGVDVDGRPTLILFPFKYGIAKTKDGEEEDILEIGLDDGSEHPGTGTGTGNGLNETLKPTTDGVLPQTFPIGRIHAAL